MRRTLAVQLNRSIFILAALFIAGVRVAPVHAALSPEQVTTLVEPIALYPDKLLQQILPAATFPDQIADAALLIRSKEDAELIKDQQWDDSVKIIATYSGVLKMMYQKLDWTTELGNAFLEDHQAVLGAIQTLRSKAQSHGNLKSNEQQKISSQSSGGDTYITIEQADPQVVYVPQQTSTVVYSEPVDNTANVLVPMATFGLGLALGSALSDDDDDDHYYYGGGYGGPMWGGDSYDDWADTRRARNEDRHDEIMDRQDFRQDQRGDRQDFRQDYARDNPEQINRENAAKARENRQANQGTRQTTQANRQTTQANRATTQGTRQAAQGTRDQKLNDARASMNSQGFSGSGNYGRGTRSSQTSWSGSGGSSYASRSASRGSSSRSGSGSYGGGGYSRGSSGFSGGGGGGMRGGGGGSRGGGGRGGGGRR